jgi:uncharacterized protein
LGIPPYGRCASDAIRLHAVANFGAIIDRAMALGINHFETARGYGTSETQYGPLLKKYPRESYILQTKGGPRENPEEFRKILETSFKELQLEEEGSFVDLFSFHGINKPEHLDWVVRPGGCMDVVKEYQAAGKIKFVGFSTHGMVPLIIDTINTGLFDYCNIHYQFIGSYTATGTGPTGSMVSAVEAARKQDMGVFIISPTDKGGALYEPPKSLYKACLPLTPIGFHNLWLWSQEGVHTLVVGAARPADFDEHVEAAMSYERRKELSGPVADRLHGLVKAQFGEDFFSTWFQGLPDAYSNPEGLAVTNLYWLWFIIKAWGMYNFALKR